MRWADGLMPNDERLAGAIESARAHADDVTVDDVLRHVPGRRITALGTTDAGCTVVVKIFHGPRARGNQRRLEALHDAGLTGLVPTPLGHDPSGRVGVLDFRPGTVLDQLPDEAFLAACQGAGKALGRLHRCGAQLDREWTLADELQQLVSRTPESCAGVVHDLVTRSAAAPPSTVVPSHRDCHPRQLVADERAVFWIDLDDCAMAAPGLDVGNMLAHLTREHLLGRRSGPLVAAARLAFRNAYGWRGDDTELHRWEILSLARLAGLAETRHHSLEQRDALLEALHLRLWEVVRT